MLQETNLELMSFRIWNIIQSMRNDLYAYVMANLDARRIALARVSREAGIPYESLKKIAHRRTPNPGVKHVQALADFFDRIEPAESHANHPQALDGKSTVAINSEANEAAHA